MVKLGMDPTPGLASTNVAKAYVAAVEGPHQELSSTRTTSENSRRLALRVRGPPHAHPCGVTREHRR
jgi:hypothetical protein